MPRHFYPPEQKAAALDRLQANGGNVALTHLQTGIPQRTLYGWRQEIWLQQLQRIQQSSQSQQQRTPPPPPPLTDLAGAPDIADEVLSEEDNLQLLNRIRQRLITELANMANEGLMLTSPNQRIHALTTLLDRLMKLDDHLKPYLPADNQVRRIEYIYPDGSTHQVPPWYAGNDDAEEFQREYYGES